MNASDPSPHAADVPPAGSSVWTYAAFLASLATLAGSLYLSLGMELVACPLCFYQRTFVMGVVGVLAVGLLTGACRGGVLSLLALPAAVGGVGVAAFHVYLEMAGKLECPGGVGGIGTAPQQSLAALTVLLVFLMLDVLALHSPAKSQLPAIASSLVLGVLFAGGAIVSAPKPKVPDRAYDTPLNTCRVPYKAS